MVINVLFANLAVIAVAVNGTVDAVRNVPSPPVPPYSPPYHAPPWPPTNHSSEIAAAPAQATCTSPAGNCWNSLCCEQPELAPVYGCFKRVGRSFAQCRPKFGWFNHTEVLSGTCKDTEMWQCPETWLTDVKPDRPAPEARKGLPSANTIVRDGFWDYTCSAEYADCTGSECCANPSFGCYKRFGRHFAMCRPRVANCVDYDWLCPGWERCAAKEHDDCTTSLCCRESSHQCQRRPHVFYAQCRSEKLPCTPWQERSTLTSEDVWICPGWEVCSAAYEECTLSRCCADPNYSCYLNKTSGASGHEWYAQCRPKVVHNETVGMERSLAGSTGNGVQLSSAEPKCDGSSDWVCPQKWMAWRDVIVHNYAEPMIEKHPKGIAALVIGLFVGCAASCACCVAHRRKVRKALEAAQNEINELKLQQEIAKAKETVEGAALTAN